MLPITLRPYQIEAVNIAVKKLLAHHEPFIEVLGTGSGKSHIIAEVCKQLNCPVLILQPSKEILEQNYAKMEALGAKNISYYSASKNSKIVDIITFATIGSIKNYSLFAHFQYVLVDEADCIDPKGMESRYMKLFSAIKPKGIMGLTATPYRRVTKYFTEGDETYYTSGFEMINRIYPFFFKSIAFKVELEDLIKQKYLSPIKYFLGPPPKGLFRNKLGSDYTFESVVKASDLRKTQAVKAILYCLKNHKRTIVFVPSVSNANAITALLALENIYCPTISAETPAKERSLLLNKYRKGDIKLIINCGVFLCVSEDTEILTREGFKTSKELNENDLVAQYENEEISFTNPNYIIKRPLVSDEFFVELIGKYHKLKVTNKHNLLYKTSPLLKNYKLDNAENLINRRCIIPTSGTEVPIVIEVKQEIKPNKGVFIIKNSWHYRKTNKLSDIESKKLAAIQYDKKHGLLYKNPNELSLEECLFIGFWVGDGNVHKTKNNGIRYSVAQSCSNPEMINWIEDLLHKLDIHYNRYYCKPKETYIFGRKYITKGSYNYNLNIGNGGTFKEIKGLYRLIPYLKKEGSPYYWGFTQEQTLYFLKGLQQADGYQGNNKKSRFTDISCANSILINLLQSICTCRGITLKANLQKETKFTKTPLFQLSYRVKNYHHISNNRLGRFKDNNIDQNVWCVNMPKGTIITRYKGSVTIMGNCGLDVPEIDAVIWDRNTAHPRIIYQGLGRGLRLDPSNPDKILHVYDISGSIHKIGRIEDLKIIKEADGFRDKLVGKPNMREKDLTGKPVFTQKLSDFNK